MPRARIARRTALHATSCSDGFGYFAEPHTRLRQQAFHSGHYSQLAWKLFLLAPRMLLARTTQRGAQLLGLSGIAGARSSIPTG